MSKAKWVHKWVSESFYCPCGAYTYHGSDQWTKVTCPKCLLKRPKPKTNLYFELDGKIYITEKTKSGKIVSQEEIDGIMVLKYLIRLLEQGLREELDLDKICEYNGKVSRCADYQNDKK